jgi:hypothetical protein
MMTLKEEATTTTQKQKNGPDKRFSGWVGAKTCLQSFCSMKLLLLHLCSNLPTKSFLLWGHQQQWQRKKDTDYSRWKKERKKERKKDAPQKFLTEKKEDERFSVCNS